MNSEASDANASVRSTAPLNPHAGHGHKKQRPLSLWPLVALIFFEVSGGPFGIEDAVGAAGPLLVIIGFLVLPLVWSIPEALVTAELATAFPEDAGYVAWVTAAFGPFWGFQKGFWAWVAGVTDNSIYPVLFVSYLDMAVPDVFFGWRRILLCIALSIALAYLNYRGLTIVGYAAVGMTIFIIVPFLFLIGFCAPHLRPANWAVVDLPSVDWMQFLNIMFWNLNYWDSVSTLAGEVQQPAKLFPRALSIAVVLVVSVYIFPPHGLNRRRQQRRLGLAAGLLCVRRQAGGGTVAAMVDRGGSGNQRRGAI
eukprot:jgi/Botrbrau1/23675/Bobra.55_2s0056.1